MDDRMTELRIKQDLEAAFPDLNCDPKISPAFPDITWYLPSEEELKEMGYEWMLEQGDKDYE